MPLRPATAADLPALAGLVNAAYRGDGSKAGWTTEADLITGDRITPARLADDLADPAVHLLVLASETPGGLLLGGVRLEGSGGAVPWMLGMLSVRPMGQAQGAGRALLAGAEAFARDHDAVAMRMHVITVRDTLLAWYARRGYVDTGARAPYTYGGELRDGLEFATLEKPLR